MGGDRGSRRRHPGAGVPDDGAVGDRDRPAHGRALPGGNAVALTRHGLRRAPWLGIALGALLALAPASTSSGRSARTPAVLYGATIDRITGLSQTLAALGALPERPTLRVVFDRSEPASYYAAAARRLDGVSSVMGELLDSSAERSISATALRTRTRSYLGRLGPYVSIWELGNELNGNWIGPYAAVAAKTRAAFSVLSAAHVPLALTLYANDFGP